MVLREKVSATEEVEVEAVFWVRVIVRPGFGRRLLRIN
jgi:hypothetical protein